MLKYLPREDRPLFFALVAVLFTMIILPWSQVLVPGRDTDGYSKAAQEEQNRQEPRTLWESATDDPTVFFTFWIAAFTAVLAWATLRLHKATIDLADGARRQETHFKISERAYVKMSHVPPGIEFRDDGGISFQIQIKNWGSTPAQVADVVICVVESEGKRRQWPSNATYVKEDNHDEAKAFLVREDYFYIPRAFPKEAFAEGIIDRIKLGEAALLVFGYVQYTDVFGQRHQAGYGRWYDYKRDIPKTPPLPPEIWVKRSNLAFIQSEEYNYDRPQTEDS